MPSYIMSRFKKKKKVTRHVKRQKPQFEKTDSTTLGMADMLELSNQEFKTTIINMLRILTDKVDSMLEQMSKVSREKF